MEIKPCVCLVAFILDFQKCENCYFRLLDTMTDHGNKNNMPMESQKGSKPIALPILTPVLHEGV
jgi:hypothetical protein